MIAAVPRSAGLPSRELPSREPPSREPPSRKRQSRKRQSCGPHQRRARSFGPRTAFDAYWQLEQLGERIEHVLLICPGTPGFGGGERFSRGGPFDDPTCGAIPFSAFAGTISGPDLPRCSAARRYEDTFAPGPSPAPDERVIRRITRVVGESERSFRDLAAADQRPGGDLHGPPVTTAPALKGGPGARPNLGRRRPGHRRLRPARGNQVVERPVRRGAGSGGRSARRIHDFSLRPQAELRGEADRFSAIRSRT